MGGHAKANKMRKQKSSSTKKDIYRSSSPRYICRRSWPDLPQEFIKLVRKNKVLVQNMRFGAILKTWRVTHKKCYAMVNQSAYLPQLSDISTLDECRGGTEHSHEFYFKRYGDRLLWKSYSQICPMIDYSKIRPWIDFSKIRPRYNSRTHSYHFDWYDANKYYDDREYYSKISPWCSHERSLIDPYSLENKPMQLVNGIWVNENRCYALSLQGTLAVIEVIDSQQRITGLGRNRAVPSVASRHFREFLVESDGDILLVFLISRKSLEIVDEVEVFKLELQKLSWIKMTNLGNRTIFVGLNCCLCIKANKAGCRSNCIYFTHRDDEEWWIYDMNSNTMVTDWDDADNFSAYRIPIVPEDLWSYV